MKTIFNNTARAELIERIALLTPTHSAKWGKMNVYQMIKHCTIWNAWVLGESQHHYKQEFLGKIFGKIALKGMIKNDKPLKKMYQREFSLSRTTMVGSMQTKKTHG